MDLSTTMGWMPDGAFIRSPRATPKALSAWHDPDYIEAVVQAEKDGFVTAEIQKKYNLGTHANPIFPEVFRRPATAAGGSLLAGQLLRDGGIVFSPAGGTHHGFPNRANGFCYFNDPVLAILSLRHQGVERIAYVDIDAHHPDGVEFGFAHDPETLMISVHEEKRWPFTGALTDQGMGQVFNLPVPRGFNDSEMAEARERLILPALARFEPEAVVLQCGADAVAEDPLSRLELSNNAHLAIVSELMDAAPRLLVLGGGGYNPWTVGRLWTSVWALLNGFDIPDRLPQPGIDVLSALSWPGRRAGRTPKAHWFTTLRDVPNEGPVRPEVADRVGALAGRLKTPA